MGAKSYTFVNFAEFWHFTRSLPKQQREAIFNALPSFEKDDLKKSYTKGGWEDIFFRDLLDRFCDKVKEDLKFDILHSRIKVLSGQSVYVSKSTWDYIENYLNQYDAKHITYLTGGIKAQQEGERAVVLLPSQI